MKSDNKASDETGGRTRELGKSVRALANCGLAGYSAPAPPDEQEARLGKVTRLPEILMVRYVGPIVAVATVMAGVAAGQPLRLDLAKVDAGDEVGGPAYDFRIGRFEIRNEDFVTFLNDALANFENERGQFIYVDTDTGDVYVNTDHLGETGMGANERTIMMFSPAAAGQIEFVAPA